MLDIFKTHTMLLLVKELNPLHTFLRDRYFPTNESTDLFATDDVLVQYRSGSKKLAPFVAPRKGGVAVLRKGHHMERYTPPYIAPKRTMTIDDLNKRGFGEALYTKLTPAQRQATLMMQDFEDLDEMISRREEAMAAETLLTNGCVMKHITDDPSKPEEKEIRFYDGETNPRAVHARNGLERGGSHNSRRYRRCLRRSGGERTACDGSHRCARRRLDYFARCRDPKTSRQSEHKYRRCGSRETSQRRDEKSRA